MRNKEQDHPDHAAVDEKAGKRPVGHINRLGAKYPGGILYQVSFFVHNFLVFFCKDTLERGTLQK